MIKRCPRLLTAICLLFLSSMAHAEFQVELVTVGPGPNYWEKFGHNMLVISNPETGISISYNYGIFDFEQENFFLNFARGKMLYQIAAYESALDMDFYRRQDRTIRSQKLNLTDQEARRLIDFLEWNREPENADYRYEYFQSNCSTKVRDALDLALEGRLQPIFESSMTPHSYRWHVNRLSKSNKAMGFGMDLGLSRVSDERLNRWQSFFLPTQFADAMANASLIEADGSLRKLVSEDVVTYEGQSFVEPTEPVAYDGLLIGIGLVLAILILLMDRPWKQPKHAWATMTWVTVAAIIGLVSLTIWGLTDHVAGYRNEYLAVFSPLLLLAVIGTRLGWSRLARSLIWLSLAIAVAALTLKMTGLFIQPWRWLLLGLPPYLVCAAILYRRIRSADQASHS